MASSSLAIDTSLAQDWPTLHGGRSLPFVLAKDADPEVVLSMLSRGWFQDLDETDGIPLLGHIYARTPAHTGYLPGTLPGQSASAGYSQRLPKDAGAVVVALCDAGANPWVCWSGSPDGVSPIAHGIYDKGQSSLIHYALAKSDAGMVQWLLDHPNCPSPQALEEWKVEGGLANFSTLSRTPYTPQANNLWAGLLHLAANSNKEAAADMVARLLAYGMDPNALDSRGFTPLFFVRRLDVLNVLLEGGAVNPGPPLLQYWRHHLETAQTLSTFRAPLIKQSAKNQSPEELRQQQSPALLHALMADNKTTAHSLFRQAGFGYDHTFPVKGGAWNLMTPVLLRPNLEKSDSLINWLEGRQDWRADLGGGATNFGIALARLDSWRFLPDTSASSRPAAELLEDLDGALSKIDTWFHPQSVNRVFDTALLLGVIGPYGEALAKDPSVSRSGTGTISSHYRLLSPVWLKTASGFCSDPEAYAAGHGSAARLLVLGKALAANQVKAWKKESVGALRSKMSLPEDLMASRLSMLLDDPSPDAPAALLYLVLFSRSVAALSKDAWAPHSVARGEDPVIAVQQVVSDAVARLDQLSTSAWNDRELSVVEDFCALSPGDLGDVSAWVRRQRLARSLPKENGERSRAPRM